MEEEGGVSSQILTRNITKAAWLLLALSIVALTLHPQARAEVMVARPVTFQFPRPAKIEPNIKFWVDVFSAYSERDFLVHDKDQVWRIYQVLRLPGYGTPRPEEVDWANNYLKEKYIAVLNRLAAGVQPVTSDEQRVAAFFKSDSRPDYTWAAQNLRVQQGMSEPFRDSMVRARAYLPGMEPVFTDLGLPPGLAILPAVESGFHRYARSKAGALGMWQFTRATAKDYMDSGRADRRYNTGSSTEAAARLLAHNYELLGNWPLAITAYNYGTAGMVHAVEECGNDYCSVLRKFSGAHFGFASKNYYPEFLAALQVYQNKEAYFPGIEEERPEFDDTPPPRIVMSHRRHYVRGGLLRVRNAHGKLVRVAYVSLSHHGHHHLHHAVYHTHHGRLRHARA